MAKKFSTAILFELPCFTGGELGIRTPGSFWEHDISSLVRTWHFRVCCGRRRQFWKRRKPLCCNGFRTHRPVLTSSISEKTRVQIEMGSAPKRSIFFARWQENTQEENPCPVWLCGQLPGLNARKTGSKQITRSTLSDRNTERSLRYEIRRQGIQKIPGDYEQGADADRLPHQQADGALSSPIQPNPSHLHRQENPLLRHQKERCDRFYERP